MNPPVFPVQRLTVVDVLRHSYLGMLVFSGLLQKTTEAFSTRGDQGQPETQQMYTIWQYIIKYITQLASTYKMLHTSIGRFK